MSSHYTDRVPFIIPAGNKGDADAVFSVIDPDVGGASSFTVPLNASGTGTPTHWGSYGPLLVDAYAAMTGTNQQLKTYVDSAASLRGRTTASLGVIQSFKQQAKIDAPGGDFWAFCTAQGLKRVEDVI